MRHIPYFPAVLAIAALVTAVAITPRNTPALAAATFDVDIEESAFTPATLTVPVGSTVTWRNKDTAAHTATSDRPGGFDSGVLTQGQSFSFTFDTTGTFNYVCDIHPSIEGAIVVGDTTVAPTPTPTPFPIARPAPTPIPSAPAGITLNSPADGATLDTFGPTLAWINPQGVSQYHLQVIPAHNDGPGIDLHRASAETSFAIAPPPGWYGLLPDMTYTWRLRVSRAATFVGTDHPSWSSWSQATFRTPAASSATLSPVQPAQNATVPTWVPVLQWANSRDDVFYYEVQLSKDRYFNTNPTTAWASVYGALIHGGVTTPLNSYAVPTNFPLEPATLYFWRVRPRVQGDGTPVDWSSVWSFKTPWRGNT